MNSFLIGIAGGTGSGKSTFTKRLKNRFGDRIAVISHDDYYRSQDHLPFEERRLTNYDHPDALETDLLVRHLKLLRAGESIECPVYDFTLHTRSKETRHIEPSPVIIVEGILLFSDEEVRKLLDLKIFVETDADERILRRIRRDVMKRGRQFDDIMTQYLTTVKPMHYQYVEPTRRMADLVLNGGKNEMAFAVAESFVDRLLREGGKE